MKTILCYGDSNTYGWPGVQADGTFAPRYGPDVRWGGVLRQKLGEGYWVIEEGLGGRTTVWDDPVEGEHKNGKRYLIPCLESHLPIDLVALMLGTNDLKSRFAKSPSDIAYGAGTLVGMIQHYARGLGWEVPQVLLICPPPVGKLTALADLFAGSVEKSRQLAPYYQREAQFYGCEFLDAGQVIVSSDRDGIHFDASEQIKLGEAVAERVKQILG